MSDYLLIRDGRIVDTDEGRYLDESDLLVADQEIMEVGNRIKTPPDARVIDARGAAVLPGLIDAHVHLTAATAALGSMQSWSTSYHAAHSFRIAGGMLSRGFTSVRDCGGADFGFAQAQREGLLRAPKVSFCGHALSQTGGHGDDRLAGDDAMHDLPHRLSLGRIADGRTAARVAARDELRKGADFLKVMASGGVASPTDRIDSTQYAVDELEVIVQEAAAANRYVAAHAYTPQSVIRAMRAGVRSVEHGNLIDDEAVAAMAHAGAFLVPTLVTYWALKREGIEHGLSRSSWEKVDIVLGSGLQALEKAVRAGVPVAFGTDLLGGMHAHQGEEFRIRSEVHSPAQVLRCATTVAAQLLNREGTIGTLAPGASADIVITPGDPLTDIAVLADLGRRPATIIQDGQVVVERAE